MSIEEIASKVCNVLFKWIDRDVRLYPVIVGYLYTMNIDPILTLVTERYRDAVQNLVEFKEDLSNIRRLLYSAAYEDYESPTIRDITFVDRVKASICAKLAEKYCNKFVSVLKECIQTTESKDPTKLITLGTILRIFEWQRLLNNELIRISIRQDILSGWLKGVEHALQDLVGDVCGIEKLREYVRSLDLRALVYETVPVGYASLDTLVCPACVEPVLNELVDKYGRVNKIVELCRR